MLTKMIIFGQIYLAQLKYGTRARTQFAQIQFIQKLNSSVSAQIVYYLHQELCK
jgi:hypothetical protein